MKNYKQRMYGLVPYNISEIQKGIQFGHAVVEYGLASGQTPEYQQWAKQDKTFIILNGGTTNEGGRQPLGTLQNHRHTLQLNGVNYSKFYEPDLNDALTAVVFLVDERVYDKETYPDFGLTVDQFRQPFAYEQVIDHDWRLVNFTPYMCMQYSQWVAGIGGRKNEFLRFWLKQFRLA